MAESIQSIANAVFMPYVVAVLLGTGLFLSIRTRFVQFRRFPEAVRAMLAREKPGAGGALSPFQAFMTALGASVGTGNIAGVATAIISGGPGALFWIWVYGLVATAIKFAEAVLAVEFRKVNGDTVAAGPMYYLRDGLKSPRLAWAYALAGRHRRVDDDAVHAAELDRDRSQLRVRVTDLGRRHRGCAAGRGRDSGRHPLDRPRGRGARAAEGRVVLRRRLGRDRHVRGASAASAVAGRDRGAQRRGPRSASACSSRCVTA